ncbi:MAG: HAD family hydrolase [Myxococcota bacterium]|nr:HAD family hydrolase [Myxococcota bacterium]
MISHLVFDFFGTLVAYSSSRTSQGYRASHAQYRSAGGDLDYTSFLECWSAGFAQLDADTADTLREYSMTEAAAAFGRHASFEADPDTLARLASSYLREWNEGVRYIDGVASMLARLGGRFDLSIITNTHDPHLVPAHLKTLGVLPLFSRVVTSVSFGMRKPSPSIFEFALKELAVSPGQCLYVGDSHGPDYEGPRAVGIRSLLIDPDGVAPVPPRERIGSILELESIVATL